LQLAHVARLVVPRERFHCIGRDDIDLLIHSLRTFPNEKLDKKRNILSAFAQSRQTDREDVAPSLGITKHERQNGEFIPMTSHVDTLTG